MSNYTQNYLNLPLDLLKNVKYHASQKIDGCNVILIQADTIRKDYYTCDKCGSVHKHTIKEYKPIFNKFSILNNNLVVLNINKKRFECFDCGRTFTESIPDIDKHARISNNLKKIIQNDFIILKTNKDIAIKNFVSQSTVSRLSSILEEYIEDIDYNYLPAHIGIDEFKATKDSKDSMACLIIDHDNKQPFDILPSRKSADLSKYFSKFSKSALDNVKIVTMDMYDPYVLMAKKFFKNATIVFDKFHVVQNFTRALNQTRIAFMNTLETSEIKYKHLKKYWKSLLSFNTKPSNEYYSLPLFEEKTNIHNVVNTMIGYDEQLKNSYNCYQVLFYHLNNKDFDKVFNTITCFQDKVSEKLQTALKTFIKQKEYCINAYENEYSNALTESIIQKIKLIKRNAYGFKNFLAFKKRIFHYFKTKSLRNSLTKLPKTANIRLTAK